MSKKTSFSPYGPDYPSQMEGLFGFSNNDIIEVAVEYFTLTSYPRGVISTPIITPQIWVDNGRTAGVTIEFGYAHTFNDPLELTQYASEFYFSGLALNNQKYVADTIKKAIRGLCKQFIEEQVLPKIKANGNFELSFDINARRKGDEKKENLKAQREALKSVGASFDTTHTDIRLENCTVSGDDTQTRKDKEKCYLGIATRRLWN